MKAFFAALLAALLSGYFGYYAGEAKSDAHWKWVMRGLEEDGAIWIHGDFNLLGPRSCKTP